MSTKTTRKAKAPAKAIYKKDEPKPRVVGKSRKKLVDGGSVSKRYRLVQYDVWGNQQDGFHVNSSLMTDRIIDLPKGSDDKAIITVLKEQKILSDVTTHEQVEVLGEDNTVLYFNDKSSGFPLFELQYVGYDRFTPKDGRQPVSDENKSKLLHGVSDVTPVTNPVPTGEVVEDVIETETILSTEEQMLNDNLVDGRNNKKEIYTATLTHILGRKPKYEEQVGNVKLRMCFLRPYYHIL
jgi:hypothetical protein